MRADLRGFDSKSARLHHASLDGARLDGVDLRKVKGLTQAQLNVALGDGTTQLPKGLRRPNHWST